MVEKIVEHLYLGWGWKQAQYEHGKAVCRTLDQAEGHLGQRIKVGKDWCWAVEQLSQLLLLPEMKR